MATVKISELSAVTTPLGGTEVLACVQTTTKKITTDELAEHAVDTLLAADAADPTTGDDLVAERAGTEKLLDLDDVAAYAVASGWSEASEADPAVAGDMILANRSGTIYELDIDTITSYAQSGVAAATLNGVASLDEATLAAEDEYLVVQSGVAKKTDIEDIETKLWADYATYVAGLSDIATLAAADVLYVLDDGATAKYTTMAEVATYVQSAIGSAIVATVWDGDSVDPILATDVFPLERSDVLKKCTADEISDYVLSVLEAGSDPAPAVDTDELVLFRSGTAYSVGADDLATYVLNEAWGLAAAGALADANTLMVGQSDVAKEVALSTVKTYVLSGVQSTALDVSGLDAAGALNTADKYLVWQSDTEKYATLSTIEAKLWTDYGTYVHALDDITALAGADEFYVLDNGSTAKKATITEVVTCAAEALFDYADAGSIADSDKLLMETSGTQKTLLASDLLAYIETNFDASTLDFDISAFDSAVLDNAHLLFVSDGATEEKATVAELEAVLWADFRTYTVGLSAVTVATDTDKFWVDQGGTAKYVTGTVLATYMAAEIASTILGGAFDADDATSFLTGDLILTERSGTRKTADGADVATFVIGELAGSDTGTPQASDEFLFERAGAIKRGDIADLGSYIVSLAFDNGDPDPIQSGDLLAIERSGTAYTADVDLLQTYILTGMQDTALAVGTIGAAGALTGSDKYLVWQSDVDKYTTLSDIETKLWADFLTYVHGLSDITTLADDDEFYVLDGGATAKYGTMAEVATYITAELWAASAASSVVTADTLLIDHSGTMYEATVDQLQTFILDGIQADVLDISGLNSATVDSSDLVLVCEGGTGKKATVSALATGIFDTFDTYVGTLDPIDPVTDSDKIFIVQGGAGKYVTPVVLGEYMSAAMTTELQGLDAKTTPVNNDILFIQDSEAANALKELTIGNLWDNLLEGNALGVPWQPVASSKYTALPPTTSTLTMSDTGDMAIGLPLKYAYGGTTYYGIITAVSEDASITIAGAAFDTGQSLTALHVGLASQVVVEEFHVDSPYGDAVEDILAEIGERNYKWQRANAYLVVFSGTNHWPDSGVTEPKINIKIDGSLVSTNDSNNGIQLSATADTWVDNSAVAISTSNYDIERGDELEIRCTVVGTTGDAECLTVQCVFVYE